MHNGAMIDGIPIVAGLALAVAVTVLSLSGSALATDQAPGQRFEIRVEDLPPPYATGSASNSAAYKCCPPGQTLTMPEGFRFNAFATGVAHARWLEVAPGGDVFVAQSGPGRIALLRDADGDGVAEVRTVFASGFQRPHGMAVRPGWLYIADIRAVWRIAYEPGQTVAHAAPERVTPAGALGGGSGHWTRSLAFSPNGTRIHIAIGSRGNIGEDPEPRATVRSFDADGGDGRTYAAGLRNPVGMAFYPGTDDLYVVVNERDGLGDDLVPDYLTRLEPGGFYGWPYSYLGANPEPGMSRSMLKM